MSRLVPYRNRLATRATAPAARREGAQPEAAPAPQDTGGRTPVEDRIAAVAAYIPAEILAFYVPAVQAIELLKNPGWHGPGQWIALGISWVLVPVYFLWIGRNDDRRWQQVLLSTLAFPIWAYATNRDIGVYASYYDPQLSTLLLLVFSLATAFLLPKKASNSLSPI
jgi:hypothetical protein